MRGAIERSRITPQDLAFIKAHGTSTQLNDKHEALAIERLLDGENKVLISALKGHLGHTTDASGLVESLLAGYAAHRNIILPIKNLDAPEFPLNFATRPVEVESARYFLTNNFGFGGNNC